MNIKTILKKPLFKAKSGGGLAVLMASLFALTACSNVLDASSGKKTSADGKTYLVVGSATVLRSSTQMAARSISYDADADALSNLVLTGTRSGGEEQTLATATSLSALTGTQIEIQTGTWSFTLTAELNGISFADSTTATIEAEETNKISFTLASTVSYGGLSISLSFSDADSAISSVVATLCNASQSEEIDTLSITEFTAADDGTYTATYSRSIDSEDTALSGGTYWLTFDFYADGVSEALNSLPYCVRIANGITTTYTQSVSLNETYTITYYDNNGSLADGEAKTYKYSRKSDSITLPQMEKDGYSFAGWYENSDFSGSAVTEIASGSTGDKTLYARYYNTASGRFSENNSSLTISVDTTTFPYLNSGTITFSAADSDGNAVTSDVTYTAALLYKGTDINSLDSDKEYYTVDESAGTISLSVNTPLPSGYSYQLYVTATYNCVISSSTFTVTANDLSLVSATYQQASWSGSAVEYTENTANAEPLTESSTALSTGFYIAQKDVTISNRITVSGNVSIILARGVTLTASQGITVSTDNSLTIYTAVSGSGTFVATGYQNAAAIGGVNASCGSVVIHDGLITVTGGAEGAGIGGGGDSDGITGGAVTVYGGTITATGGSGEPGIGGRSNGGTLIVYDGEITSTGSSWGAGIGGGFGGDGGTVKIYGGTVAATGSYTGAGIGGGGSTGTGGAGGTVEIYGGTVTAIGGTDTDHDDDGNEINTYASGIGAGYGNSNHGTLTVDSSLTVTAGTSADDASATTADAYIASPATYISITK